MAGWYQRARDSDRVFDLQQEKYKWRREDAYYTTKLIRYCLGAQGKGHLLLQLAPPTHDDVVSRFVSKYLSFRKESSPGDLLIHSDISWSPSSYERHRGMRRCGACDFCVFIIEGDSLTLSNGRTLRCVNQADCKTSGAIYVLTCVSKTIRTVHRRLQDHIYMKFLHVI